VAYIATRLGRTERAIRVRLCRLGLSGKGCGMREIARRLGVDHKTIARAARQLGLEPPGGRGVAVFSADQVREIIQLLLRSKRCEVEV